MRSIYYSIIFLVLLIIFYYFSISDYRTAFVSIMNFLSIVFLLSNSSKINSIIRKFFIIIFIGEFILFSYHIISGFNFNNILEFFSSQENLSTSVYQFKGSKIFGVDTNMYATFFGVLSIIFKQFNRKYLSLVSFIFLFLTFSRSAILIGFLILLYPYKKLNLKYLYFLIAIAMFFFLTYQGDNFSINLKVSTYLLFFQSLSKLGPMQLLLGTTNLDTEVTDDLLIKLGTVTQGHTFPGSILTFGLIYIFSSMVIFFILWRRHQVMRLPILFLITYSLFSVTSFSVPTPPLIIASIIDEKFKKIY